MTDEILSSIREERSRQNFRWGLQRHPLPLWAAILGEEVGEVNRAVIETAYDEPDAQDLTELRKELVQVAAVSVAIIEQLDEVIRGDWVLPSDDELEHEL